MRKQIQKAGMLCLMLLTALWAGAATTATWDFQNDIPAGIQANTNYQGVAVDVESDVAGIFMHVDATSGKLYCVGRNNAQMNPGTVLQVPVVSKEDVVTVVGYPGYCHFAVGGEENGEETTVAHKATSAEVSKGYVEVTATAGNNYIYKVSVTQKPSQAPALLKDFAATATFPFNLGTEGQTAEFGEAADHFISSKVTYGEGLVLKDKNNGSGIDMTRFDPVDQNNSPDETNAIRFIIQPKYGLEFTPKKVSLTVPSIKVDSKSTLDSTYFDWKVTVRGLPGGTVEMLLRAHSDKGTNYYPENIFALSKECPKGTLVFTRDVDVASMICRDANRPGNLPMTLNIPYEVPVKVPTLAKEDIQYVDLDKTLGIDAGVSVAGLITTIGPKEIGKDMLDWHEAVHAYHADHAGTNLFTKTATKATRDDLLRLVDEYNSGDYRLISMLTIGLRDGSPTDEAHGWKPVCDPCAPMFSWLKYRTNADGSRYYNDRQIAIIGHTKLWRKFIRQLIANRRHYFFEQARWDRVHDTMTEVFAQESPVAAELNKEYEILGDKIRVESTYLLSCELLTGSAMENYEIVSMEKLNLNDVKENIKFRSLYSTVANDWNMNPKNGYKVSASKNSNTATIDFGRPVTKEEVMAKCKETAHWQFPVDIKVNNTTATLYCEPTREGLRCRNSEWSDHYTNRAMHLALLKHDVARIVMRRGILYKEVPAKDTSKACHVCGYIKKESAADRKRNGGNPLDKEQCLAKKINYRRGREFICGNPACPMHGIIQNSDVNGSFNVRNLVKFSFKDFGKILPAK